MANVVKFKPKKAKFHNSCTLENCDKVLLLDYFKITITESWRGKALSRWQYCCLEHAMRDMRKREKDRKETTEKRKRIAALIDGGMSKQEALEKVCKFTST